MTEALTEPEVLPVAIFTNRFTVKLPLVSAYRPVPPVMVFVSTMDLTSGFGASRALPVPQAKILSPLAAMKRVTRIPLPRQNKASEAILALKPVTFRYKHEFDPNAIPQFVLLAEQVATVSPDLVTRDEQGKVYTVRYEAVNAMLLNESSSKSTARSQWR